MEMGLKVIVVLLLLVIFIVLVLGLMTNWFGQSQGFANSLFEYMKNFHSDKESGTSGMPTDTENLKPPPDRHT
ncbi:MAG: hypothetical protein J7K72_01505 [Candidatus Aenigmarchaeota archaeon]|nr:hypothetical protein [Candidatus Aenigmarchaeota archaeon]